MKFLLKKAGEYSGIGFEIKYLLKKLTVNYFLILLICTLGCLLGAQACFETSLGVVGHELR